MRQPDRRNGRVIRYRITPVQDAEQFMAKLATDDVDRVKRDIEHQIEERLHDAVGDLYRRFGEAVERVSERLQEDDNGKPLVFRDAMIMGQAEGGFRPDEADGGARERSRQDRQKGALIANLRRGVTAFPIDQRQSLEFSVQSRPNAGKRQ